MREPKTRILPGLSDIPETHFFNYIIIIDLLIFLPILVLIPFNIIALILQKKHKTFQHPFFFTYSILRLFLFLMMLFVVIFQYSVYFKNVLVNLYENDNFYFFIRYIIESFLFFLFFLWIIFLSFHFHILILKHQILYGDNKSLESESESEDHIEED